MPTTVRGPCRRTRPSCPWPRRRREWRPARRTTRRPRRTSRSTVAWASPGSSIAISTTGAPSSPASCWGAPGAGRTCSSRGSRREPRRRIAVDFDDTPEEATFRKEVREWLSVNAGPESGAFETWQSRYSGRDGYEGLERAKEFQAKKAEAGFAALHWPVEWGGRAMPPIYQVIYAQEETRYLVPRGYFEIGLGMCMPTLFAFGTEEQKRRHAPAALRGQEVWCQLFSEPGAGSDLAGLRTKAQREGDEWVINGQKIWTSGAHWADWAILVARSDPKAPKHKGLTFFFLSMKSSGIETRRIKQISGASHFNEVYFTDVRIPDRQRLGAVGQGWKVSLTTLMNERYTIGGRSSVGVEDIFELARKIEHDDGPALKNAAVRDKLADW